MNEHEKIKLLRRLVKEYLATRDFWSAVDIMYDRFDRVIYVTWYNVIYKKDGLGKTTKLLNSKRKTIDVDEIDAAIKSYRNKIAYAKRSKV